MDILSTLFQQQSRKIGMIIPSVVVSEKHTDTLEITEHPVEVGAAIADHAYKKPSEVVMEVGFANRRSSGPNIPIGPSQMLFRLRKRSQRSPVRADSTGGFCPYRWSLFSLDFSILDAISSYELGFGLFLYQNRE